MLCCVRVDKVTERGSERERVCKQYELHQHFVLFLIQMECAHSRDRGKDGHCDCNECQCTSDDSVSFNRTCIHTVSPTGSTACPHKKAAITTKKSI